LNDTAQRRHIHDQEKPMYEFEGRRIPSELGEIVDPRSTVLLVWDMQNDQAGGAFNKDLLIRCAPPLIAAAAKAGVCTIWARQTPYLWNEESPAWIRHTMRQQGVDHPSKLKPRRLRESFGWQIMEPFKPGPADFIIDKRRPSIWVGNEFELQLSNRGIRTVVIIGCTTDAGVDATVGEGYRRGYFMVVAADCCGTYTEEGHKAALKRMERQADVVDSTELIRLWGA
jgi:nicotinamidase-related amidase